MKPTAGAEEEARFPKLQHRAVNGSGFEVEGRAFKGTGLDRGSYFRGGRGWMMDVID